MPLTIQEFFATATQKAAADLKDALLRLPEDKRNYSPAETSRSALDQVAECAILNGYTTDLITTRQWKQDAMAQFLEDKTALMQGEDKVTALLEENAQKLAAVIRAVPDDALETEIQLPWQKMTLAEVIAYPYWNMSYHQGQINYIASLLGLLQ